MSKPTPNPYMAPLAESAKVVVDPASAEGRLARLGTFVIVIELARALGWRLNVIIDYAIRLPSEWERFSVYISIGVKLFAVVAQLFVARAVTPPRGGRGLVFFAGALAITTNLLRAAMLSLTELGLERRWIEPLTTVLHALTVVALVVYLASALAAFGAARDARNARLLAGVYGVGMLLAAAIPLTRWLVRRPPPALDLARSALSLLFVGLTIAAFVAVSRYRARAALSSERRT